MPQPQTSQLTTVRILWVAQLGACFLFTALAFSGVVKAAPTPPSPIMPIPLGVISVMLAAASFVMPRIVYKGVARAVDVGIVEEAAPSPFSQQYREAMPKQRTFTDPVQALERAYVAFRTPFIVSIALSEAIALNGFMLYMMGFSTMVAAPFFAAGAVLIAIRFPRQERIVALFEEARGASFPASS